MDRVASFVAECFIPDVDADAVAAIDVRAGEAANDLTAAGRPVRYLGSLLVREDEVLFCQFEGAADDVRAAAERARIPFERILETARSDFPATDSA